jgi:hypothetical protein
MLFKLETRKREMQLNLSKLEPGSLDSLQMQTYILGFIDASQIAYRSVSKKITRDKK